MVLKAADNLLPPGKHICRHVTNMLRGDWKKDMVRWGNNPSRVTQEVVLEHTGTSFRVWAVETHLAAPSMHAENVQSLDYMGCLACRSLPLKQATPVSQRRLEDRGRLEASETALPSGRPESRTPSLAAAAQVGSQRQCSRSMSSCTQVTGGISVVQAACRDVSSLHA